MNLTDSVETFAPAPPGTHPPLDYPDYRSTQLRHPNHDPLALDPGKLDRTELSGPLFGEGAVDRRRRRPDDRAERRGGRAADHRHRPAARRRRPPDRRLARSRSGRPTPPAATATSATAGRARSTPTSPAPGAASPTPTARYRFTTIRPGAYPWGNHPNAWRPAHLHFSLFGRSFTQRLVTQMYFPDDPLFFQDPIYNSVPEPARPRWLVARYDHDTTMAEWALGFRFDIVLRGPQRTPFEDGRR